MHVCQNFVSSVRNSLAYQIISICQKLLIEQSSYPPCQWGIEIARNQKQRLPYNSMKYAAARYVIKNMFPFNIFFKHLNVMGALIISKVKEQAFDQNKIIKDTRDTVHIINFFILYK